MDIQPIRYYAGLYIMEDQHMSALPEALPTAKWWLAVNKRFDVEKLNVDESDTSLTLKFPTGDKCQSVVLAAKYDKTTKQGRIFDRRKTVRNPNVPYVAPVVDIQQAQFEENVGKTWL